MMVSHNFHLNQSRRHPKRVNFGEIEGNFRIMMAIYFINYPYGANKQDFVKVIRILLHALDTISTYADSGVNQKCAPIYRFPQSTVPSSSPRIQALCRLSSKKFRKRRTVGMATKKQEFLEKIGMVSKIRIFVSCGPHASFTNFSLCCWVCNLAVEYLSHLVHCNGHVWIKIRKPA